MCFQLNFFFVPHQPRLSLTGFIKYWLKIMLNGFIAAKTLLIYDYVCHVKSILFSRYSGNLMNKRSSNGARKNADRKYSIPFTSIMETIPKVYLWTNRISFKYSLLINTLVSHENNRVSSQLVSSIVDIVRRTVHSEHERQKL